MPQNNITIDGRELSTEMTDLKDMIKDPNVVAVRVDGELKDLSGPVNGGEVIETIRSDSQSGLEIIRHSTSHIMAEAVMALFPDARPTIGPSIEDGFYYDFDREDTFSVEDLERIEQKMDELIALDTLFERKIMNRQEAISYFQEKGEPYKVEILSKIDDEVVSLYQQGDFVDLCRGPHVPSTGYIKAFKLLSVAGAYWRGDERNKMLQRIYGTAFSNKKELKQYLNFLEEARKRDHRRLGRELELFMISDEVGPGMVIYMPKGGMLRTLLEDFEKKVHFKRGYDIVYGPSILRGKMWETSGHMDNYKENMYFTELEGQLYGIKPMNCLSHILIYKNKVRSYRDLPLRYFELGNVTRHEKSGVLHGLLRTRQFTQDDAHIFCRPDQLIDEVSAIIEMVEDVMAVFGFEYEMEVSTRPEKSIGSEEDWEMATKALMDALKGKDLPFDINEGDGAFYGPKIDVKIKDAIGRQWQCATIQCDFTLPARFDMNYIGSDGQKHRPVMLHRVILGSIERFIGVLIEHFAGAFPVWLSPVQAVVMNITDAQADYALRIAERLKEFDVRAEVDTRNEKIGFKIRESRLQKVPYMLIVGDKEKAEDIVTVRERNGNQQTATLDDFISMVKDAQPSV
ncbi:MAG: threonine--tRNA ligase [Deltaproteobacteria bacterium]|nr:threonine--tRNA ligase [Deltaproteobacteria bacterium]